MVRSPEFAKVGEITKKRLSAPLDAQRHYEYLQARDALMIAVMKVMVHVAVDDHSRTAYVEVVPDQLAPTCAAHGAFLHAGEGRSPASERHSPQQRRESSATSSNSCG